MRARAAANVFENTSPENSTGTATSSDASTHPPGTKTNTSNGMKNTAASDAHSSA